MTGLLANIMKESDFNQFETQFLYQCAPVLLKVKVSNLFIMKRKDEGCLAKLALPENIKYRLIYQNDQQSIFLVYDEVALQKLIKREEYQMLFTGIGYKKTTLEEIFVELSSRYQKSRNEQGLFPHEIGVLLGIPMTDVLGFLMKKQEILAGEWKVYEKGEQASKWFLIYEKARAVCLDLNNHKVKVQGILDLL